MKKILEWLQSSNRWKHLLGGCVIGICADTCYSAVYTALVAGACLEYKDRAHGGKWDWIDLGLTVLGGILSCLIKLFLKN